MSRRILTLFFLNIFLNVTMTQEDSANGGFITDLDKKLNIKFFEYANSIVKWLEDINRINNSELEKMLNYTEIQSKLDGVGSESRGTKKILPFLLIPIVFKIGAMSTWMLLTTFLAAKSVAIGLILLVFKIVVSSAKAASLFTIWKIKKHHHELPWPVYHDHHDHHGHHDHHDHHDHYVHGETLHHPYTDWSSHPSVYKTITPGYPEIDFAEDKKLLSKTKS